VRGMSDASDARLLSMGEMSARSGVSEGTLRMWETRHDFPEPTRLPSGHRRYSAFEVKRVQAVVRDRRRGLSLATAIERARAMSAEPRPSVFAALRDGFPHLQTQLMRKPALIALSHAIEDETCARANPALMFGCFQHERFYRQEERRWRDMARTAERALVFADFDRARRPRGAPIEIPIRGSDPLMREWVLVCETSSFAACMVGFEPPAPAGGRRFETIWSAERAVVRAAARACAELATRAAPDLAQELIARLDEPLPPAEDELRGVIDLTARIVRYSTSE
jgi:MerR family transcriptional regulator, light-induced transcriptional regulator